MYGYISWRSLHVPKNWVTRNPYLNSCIQSKLLNCVICHSLQCSHDSTTEFKDFVNGLIFRTEYNILKIGLISQNLFIRLSGLQGYLNACFCGLVVRVPGYRSRGLSSIPALPNFLSSGSGMGFTQPHEHN
jgi:hypothetical protein